MMGTCGLLSVIFFLPKSEKPFLFGGDGVSIAILSCKFERAFAVMLIRIEIKDMYMFYSYTHHIVKEIFNTISSESTSAVILHAMC